MLKRRCRGCSSCSLCCKSSRRPCSQTQGQKPSTFHYKWLCPPAALTKLRCEFKRAYVGVQLACSFAVEILMSRTAGRGRHRMYDSSAFGRNLNSSTLQAWEGAHKSFDYHALRVVEHAAWGEYTTCSAIDRCSGGISLEFTLLNLPPIVVEQPTVVPLAGDRQFTGQVVPSQRTQHVEGF